MNGRRSRRAVIRGAALAMVLLVACTSATGPAEGPSDVEPPRADGSPGAATPAVPPIVLSVVASETGPRAESDRSYLDGMRLAVREVNRRGGTAGRPLELHVADDEGMTPRAGALLEERLSAGDAAAHLVIGPGSVVRELRPAIQEAEAPVIVLGGDLYTPRALFRQTFQTGIPALWQSRVLARYLVRDRGHRRVLVSHPRGEDAASAGRAFEDALRAEGVSPEVVVLDPEAPGLAEAAGAADAVVFVGPAEEAADVAAELSTLPEPPQLALSAESLRADFPGDLPPGTVALGTYTWAAWADPIPRVRRFRERFEAEYGRLPSALEQEGYDAVRLLAEGLEATDGRAGEPLVRRLERNRPRGETFSALPLVLGPDDHTLTDETFVGLYAVAGPGEDVEPWVEGTPWRPLIRTFTSDGERTVFLECDRRVFFPAWRKNRPSPKFGRSRLGIVTGRGDPLH